MRARREHEPEVGMSDDQPSDRRLSALTVAVAVMTIVLLAVAALWLATVLFR